MTSCLTFLNCFANARTNVTFAALLKVRRGKPPLSSSPAHDVHGDGRVQRGRAGRDAAQQRQESQGVNDEMTALLLLLVTIAVVVAASIPIVTSITSATTVPITGRRGGLAAADV